MSKYKYEMTGDVGISYADCGPWRSYDIDGAGDTIEEFFENAVISEVDQDGGELDCYGLEDAPNEVINAVESYLGIKRE